jgi:hypothetical protein
LSIVASPSGFGASYRIGWSPLLPTAAMDGFIVLYKIMKESR